ncbi:squalene/phytoene synthase family protein [bacterium]|nr:squalene/phytoene synthase family protein [bacterium]
MPQPEPLLTSLLRQVSRSFYTTLWVLPKAVRDQVGLAYLLARTADTIADTELIPLDSRLTALNQFSRRVAGETSEPLELSILAEKQASPAERILLERSHEALALLDAVNQSDRSLVRQVLATIISGQQLDLKRFANANASEIVALGSDQELEDYTYRVAGCVGEFWTHICRSHLFPTDFIDIQSLLRKGVRFGKGLQLVNILRDFYTDLNMGRCYLPLEALVRRGLGRNQVLRESAEASFRPVYDHYLDRAQGYLHDGWDYTNQLPWKLVRVRLACAWPVLIGLDTLHLLRQPGALNPHKRVKVTRRQVKAIFAKTVALYPFPGAWRKLAGPPT